ncbi:phosphatidylinositol-4-phosphate 5-kinase [Pelomyxa schiedti]|nr:phosphatidylinositol-4-phosphate 5-kinase [Pelomyxa schiedti]
MQEVWGIKSSSTLTSTSEMEMVPNEEAEGDHDNPVDGILMKPLLVNEPQLHQSDPSFTPPFQLLCALTDTLAQLRRFQFAECTKLADKHTVLSKELSEQVSIGGTLQKAIEDTQRECSELQREHKGKWKVQRGLEGDERFIGMPCVWSQLSELLPQAQQAIVELSLSKATSSQQQQPRLSSMTTLPGCTATSSPNHKNNESNVCMECDERPPDVQLRPCGHVVLCSQCAAVMKKCLIVAPSSRTKFICNQPFFSPSTMAANKQAVSVVTMVVDNILVMPGTTYTGRVVDGEPDGRGTAKWPSGVTYDGVWLNGAMTGRGVLKWSDGGTCEGEWLNNKRDGWGVAHWTDGSWLEGLWRDDHWKRGTWHHSNSVDVRDGEWVWNATANGNDMQGWGVQRRMTTKGGATVKMVVTVYEGEWDRNKWHGVGTWKSPDGSGDIYHGQFDHGKKCGTGSILFGAGGGSYVGEWKDDVFHGRGVRLWANGDRYDGQWVQGKEHGEGTKTWSRDGSSFTGLWEGGVPTKGMRRWPNGDMFEGTFTQVPQGGGGSNCELHGEGALTLSKSPSGGVGMLKGTLNNNLFQGVSAGVQHQMGSSLPQFEHHEQIEKLKKEKRDLEAKLKEEMRAAKEHWEQVTERNNEQHSEQINQVKKNLQQLQEKLQKTQEEDDDERKPVLASHPELREAFESTKLLQSQLVTFASEFVLLDESVKKLNESLQRATESNEELASHLKKLTERKGTLVMKLNESDSACKKLLGQTLTVHNSESEIQECARNISTLTKKVLGIKSSATSTYTGPKEEESDDVNTVDDILMKPLLQFQRDNTFTPPFQLLRTLSDTLAQLQRCQFAECTKLADKHTVLSKELSEQVSIGGTLHKAIEETQREWTELLREYNGKWKLQRGLEGDERFIGMPCVWSQLSELLPQSQQAIVDLMVSKATSSSASFASSGFHHDNAHSSQQQQQPRSSTTTTAGGTTLPGCTAASTSSSALPSSSVCMECEERPPDVQLQPCGHVVLCSQCATVMKKCPHCRTFIKNKIHL